MPPTVETGTASDRVIAASPSLPLTVVVMGVAGCGKSTVAQHIAQQLGWPLAEGDDFHPPTNVAKMTAGVPLTDQDRSPWLHAMRNWITHQHHDTVVTCSALRRAYRDTLRESGTHLHFIHLVGSPQLLLARISARSGHFMPASMLNSQLRTLEPLQPDEPGLLIDIDAPPAAVTAIACRYIENLAQARSTG